MTDEAIRIGIIGLGRSGWNIHANALREHDAYSVVAVADPLAERRDEAALAFGCATYQEPEDLLLDAEVEGVVIATPSHTHVPLAKEALQSGKHVILEKPMAETVDEVDALIAASQRADRLLTVYQPRRLDADFTLIQRLIEEGRIGRVVLIRRGIYRFARRADWQTLRKFGGGELANTGPHLVDQILLLLNGRVVDVFADLQRTVSSGDAEDHVKLSLKDETGLVADIEMTSCSTFAHPNWVLMGTRGGIISTQVDGQSALKVRWFAPEVLGELAVEEGPAQGRRYGTGEEIPWQEEVLPVEQPKSPALMFYDLFHATLRERAPLYVTPESVRQQVEILQRARALTTPT